LTEAAVLPAVLEGATAERQSTSSHLLAAALWEVEGVLAIPLTKQLAEMEAAAVLLLLS
jgi:hypothetical protein